MESFKETTLYFSQMYGNGYIIDTIKQTCTKSQPLPITQLCSDSESLTHLFSGLFTLVSELVEQTYDGYPQMVAFQYGNITIGIQDESVFDVPSFC
ncbi:hypothetical protein EB796_023841 [Bugula neritina]|uniref:Uncharacterized protein n=1 Tax=Bugula neritina TaxID=10212 RepID=A0A7J7IX99_BUGNE|nr:hypothetical protein EB796_023841 [Bugula neritina]